MGRGPHLAALEDGYRTVCRQGDPQTVFISGRSGEGKTTLGEHFLASLRQDKNLAVMAGRCYDRESVPFKALDSLIDALASYLKALPETDAALLMPDDIGVLAQVFPVLQRVGVVARASGTGRIGLLDEQQVRSRACLALRSLLVRISRRSPVVWFIDDLQWGDADSAEALFEVLKPPEAPQVLFLGTYRSDEVEGSAFLNTWKELQRKHDVRVLEREVRLAPLTDEECTELVVALLGKDNERHSPEGGRVRPGNAGQPVPADRAGRLLRSRNRLVRVDAAARGAGPEAGPAAGRGGASAGSGGRVGAGAAARGGVADGGTRVAADGHHHADAQRAPRPPDRLRGEAPGRYLP